ncbi:MAG: hypothetical protein ACFE0J_09120 [Elainellaceae cyanobacterium]
MSNDQPPQESNGKEFLDPPKEGDRQTVRRVMTRLYIILLVVGLGIGAIVSVGVVMLIERLGLTDVPQQVEDNQN